MITKFHVKWAATYIAYEYIKHKDSRKRWLITAAFTKFFEENNNSKVSFSYNEFMEQIRTVVSNVNKLPNSSLNVDKSKQVSQKVDNLQPLTPEQVTPKNFQDDFPVTY